VNPRTLQKVTYGLYVVSSRNKNGKKNGLIVNTVAQVTATPPTIIVSVCKDNLTCEYIQESGGFTVSILRDDTPMKFIGLFGFQCGRDINKFENIRYKVGANDMPIVLDNTLGVVEAEVLQSMDAGSHVVFHGKVLDAQLIEEEASPLTYAYYHDVKNGKAPRNAPTYVSMNSNIKTEKEVKMKKYRCTVCGYIYDPEVGDPDSGVKAGTSFEDLPDDWVCPLCGVGKDEFEPVD